MGREKSLFVSLYAAELRMSDVPKIYGPYSHIRLSSGRLVLSADTTDDASDDFVIPANPDGTVHFLGRPHHWSVISDHGLPRSYPSYGDVIVPGRDVGPNDVIMGVSASHTLRFDLTFKAGGVVPQDLEKLIHQEFLSRINAAGPELSQEISWLTAGVSCPQAGESADAQIPAAHTAISGQAQEET